MEFPYKMETGQAQRGQANRHLTTWKDILFLQGYSNRGALARLTRSLAWACYPPFILANCLALFSHTLPLSQAHPQAKRAFTSQLYHRPSHAKYPASPTCPASPICSPFHTFWIPGPPHTVLRFLFSMALRLLSPSKVHGNTGPEVFEDFLPSLRHSARLDSIPDSISISSQMDGR